MVIASSDLYGGTLSTTMVECFAQQYNLSNANHRYHNYGIYSYSETELQNAFSRLWQTMYAQILRVNEFMEMLDRARVYIPESRKNILRGEAYALRAFLHFDLLRMFGPVFAMDSATPCIVYNNIPFSEREVSDPLPFLSSNRVIQLVLQDLETAEELLKNDRIIKEGVVRATTTDAIENFHINRHLRMNYYAVKALQARVWLWAGNKSEALEAAKAVIYAPLVTSEVLFHWLPRNQIATANNPDRAFSTEIIFGVDNRTMYINHTNTFSSILLPQNELCPWDDRLKETYEDNGNDFRYHYVWLEAGGEKDYRTFFKYAQPSNLLTADFRYVQPLIRISELYYIAAECEPNSTKGLEYLNTVRTNRNLAIEITNPSALISEIQKEYRKEFYGEGQLFFYYKRNHTRYIPNGNAATSTIEMNPEIYQIPVPLKERQFRQ
jgi:hypothetical protein